jgi:hypothetical protein
MVLRFSKKTGNIFWACSEFGCRLSKLTSLTPTEKEAYRLGQLQLGDLRPIHGQTFPRPGATVYVLQSSSSSSADNSKFYVGMTRRALSERMSEHETSPNQWVESMGDFYVLESIRVPTTEAEQAEYFRTLDMMEKHGYNNVRGAAWVNNEPIDHIDIHEYRRIGAHLFGLCYECLTAGHYAKDCPTPRQKNVDHVERTTAADIVVDKCDDKKQQPSLFWRALRVLRVVS